MAKQKERIPFSVDVNGKTYKCLREVHGTRILNQYVHVEGVGTEADTARYGPGQHPVTGMAGMAVMIATDMIVKHQGNTSATSPNAAPSPPGMPTAAPATPTSTAEPETSTPSIRTFFRVLDDSPDKSGSRTNSTLRRWRAGERCSTHTATPPEWIRLWNNGTRDPSAFDVRCEDGIHTPASVAAFLAAAKGHDKIKPEEWPEETLIRVGELAGLCAYEEPGQAWTYIIGDEREPTSLSIVRGCFVVEFEGEKLPTSIPERLKGGVLVKVKDAGRLYKAEAFALKHGFELPAETEGSVDLGGDWEEDKVQP